MVAVQVLGNDTAIKIAGSQGNFELNVFKPVMIRNLLHSSGAPGRRLPELPGVLRRGTRARPRAHRGPGRTLADARDGADAAIGYDKAAEIAKKAHHEGTTLKEAALALGYLTEADYDAAVVPENMV